MSYQINGTVVCWSDVFKDQILDFQFMDMKNSTISYYLMKLQYE